MERLFNLLISVSITIVVTGLFFLAPFLGWTGRRWLSGNGHRFSGNAWFALDLVLLIALFLLLVFALGLGESRFAVLGALVVAGAAAFCRQAVHDRRSKFRRRDS